MTVATTSMSFLVRGPVARVAGQATDPQTAAAAADAEACRLAAAVGRGDEEAFRQLYDAYHGRLVRLALVLARGDESLSQEVVQTVFVTAAEKLRRVESEAHLWNWLARVAHQQIARVWRARHRDSAVVGVEELPESATSPQPDAALEQCLDAALLELEGEDRELIERFYFDQLSQKELAEELGVTPKAVSSRLERVREKLRALTMRKLSHET
jgi:RNA polymerase sigma-70 factor (ECF subfamily)